MNEQSLRGGQDGKRWFVWAASPVGVAAWNKWCARENSGLEAELGSIGFGKGARSLELDDAILRSLVSWARSGEPMAILALESEMHVGLSAFVRQWFPGADTTLGADGYSPVRSRRAAVIDWVLGEFALTVLTVRTDATMRSALFGRMRSKFSRGVTSNRARVTQHTALGAVTSSGFESDVHLGSAMEKAPHDVHDDWSVARQQLSALCASVTGCSASSELLTDLADRVWLRDEPIEAAAEALGLSHAAARKRLSRLKHFGRENRELCAFGGREVLA